MRNLVESGFDGIKVLTGGIVSGAIGMAIFEWAATRDVLNLAPKILSQSKGVLRATIKSGEYPVSIPPPWEMIAIGILAFMASYGTYKLIKSLSRLPDAWQVKVVNPASFEEDNGRRVAARQLAPVVVSEGQPIDYGTAGYFVGKLDKEIIRDAQARRALRG